LVVLVPQSIPGKKVVITTTTTSKKYGGVVFVTKTMVTMVGVWFVTNPFCRNHVVHCYHACIKIVVTPVPNDCINVHFVEKPLCKSYPSRHTTNTHPYCHHHNKVTTIATITPTFHVFPNTHDRTDDLSSLRPLLLSPLPPALVPHSHHHHHRHPFPIHLHFHAVDDSMHSVNMYQHRSDIHMHHHSTL
jgi:hypothetical protein